MSAAGIETVTQRNVQTIARIEAESLKTCSLGERVADLMARYVGSWLFLGIQSLLLVLWMGLNVTPGVEHWDPFPFVLLNLVLSFQAAFATPIILMSENRQGRLAERRNRLDLQINMLAEQENTEQLRLLRMLCEKAGIQVDAIVDPALEEPVRPDEIIRQIATHVEGAVNQSEFGST